jgi:hypothetical protein
MDIKKKIAYREIRDIQPKFRLTTGSRRTQRAE